jgi:SAM-dependent methyltransferase
MGLKREHLLFIDRSLKRTFGDCTQGKRMMELGDQSIFSEVGWKISAQTGKEYFTQKGFGHVSIDLNAAHGALPYDLSLPISRHDWVDGFDIVTNAGTSEHVEPFSGQYECFRNIHRWVKPGGTMIHLVPDVETLERDGAWKDHCRYYYSRAFFSMLAWENGYRIKDNASIDGLIVIDLCKEKNCPFMHDKKLFSSHIARRSTGYCYPGINDSGAVWKRRLTLTRRLLFAR